MRRILRAFGGGLRNGFVALGALAFLGTVIALADYAATVGSGTNFASIVVGGVHHAVMIVCDATLGEARCATVGSTGSLQIDTPTNGNIYGALTAAVPAGTNLIGKVGIDQTTPGATNNVTVSYGSTALVADACQANNKSYAAINLSGTSGLYTTPVLAGTSAKKTYVCQFIVNNNAAVNVAFFEATNGGSCGSGQAALWGGTTAATGFQFAANGGVSIGNGGYAIMATATNQDDICAITSASTQITGTIVYVKQ